MWCNNRDVDEGVVTSASPIVMDFYERIYYFQLHWKKYYSYVYMISDNMNIAFTTW